jgi:hypothetical protein
MLNPQLLIAWADLVSSLAKLTAQRHGQDPKAIKYLDQAVGVVTLGLATEEEFKELAAEIAREVELDLPTTSAELLGLTQSITNRQAHIDAAARGGSSTPVETPVPDGGERESEYPGD